MMRPGHTHVHARVLQLLGSLLPSTPPEICGMVWVNSYLLRYAVLPERLDPVSASGAVIRKRFSSNAKESFTRELRRGAGNP